MIRKLFSGWYTLPNVSPLEGFFSRLFFAALLVFTLRNQIDFTTEPHPVGLLAILHKFGSGPYLTWLADVQKWEIFKAVFFALLAVYVSGFALPIVLPVLAVMHVLPFTLNNSQGYTHHGNQIVSCVIIIQAIAVLYYAWRDKFTLAPPDSRLRAWLLVNAQVVVTGMYFISVFTKLDNSGGMWLWNAHHTALDMIKTQRQSFLNRFDPAYAEIPPEAYWMLEHPWSARIFFGSGIFLEFFCVFAIGHRWLAPIIGVSLIVMHRAIDRLMGGVSFLYNELLCLIFLVSLPFFLAWLFERISNRWARWATVALFLIGVPLSYKLQPEGVRSFFSVGRYVLALINEFGTWNSLEKSQWLKTFQFVSPVFACSGIAIVIAIGAAFGRRVNCYGASISAGALTGLLTGATKFGLFTLEWAPLAWGALRGCLLGVAVGIASALVLLGTAAMVGRDVSRQGQNSRPYCTSACLAAAISTFFLVGGRGFIFDSVVLIVAIAPWSAIILLFRSPEERSTP